MVLTTALEYPAKERLRTSKDLINNLMAQLSKVTTERDDWKERAESSEAQFQSGMWYD